MIQCFIILESKSVGSWSWQSRLPLQSVRENLFCVSCLAPGSLRALIGLSWLVDILSLHASLLYVYLCAQLPLRMQ